MRFDELTRDELRELAPRSVALVPCGAIEQHGPHVVTGADTIYATRICDAAAEKAAPAASVIVTPPISFGISDHHKPHPGVLSLRPATFQAVLNDLGRCLVESGFRAVAFVNGHNGNEDAIRVVARDLNNGLDAAFAATSYWSVAWPELEAAGIVDGVARIPGHAGKFETALMLRIDSSFVRGGQIPPTLPAAANARHKVKPSVFPRGGNHGYGLGYSDAPLDATVELGDQIWTACVGGLANFLMGFAAEIER